MIYVSFLCRVAEFDYNNPSADSLFQLLLCRAHEYEEQMPLKGVRTNRLYTIKKSLFNDATTDDNGAYYNSSSTKKKFYVKIDCENRTVESRIVHTDTVGKYYYKEREGRDYNHVRVDANNVYQLERYYRKNKSISDLKRVLVKVTPEKDADECDYCCVIYSLCAESEESARDATVILPHGNTNTDVTRQKPYIRTAKKTFQETDELLASGNSVSSVYDTMLEKSGGPFQSTSQSNEPRDRKQIYNRQAQLNKLNQTTKNQRDDILEMMEELRMNCIVESIIIKNNAYFFFIATSRQTNDISKFCCGGNNSSVLGVDTTFNLCELWVTDSSYRNKRIINMKTGNHPVFLGPSLFHFTKDQSTFARFALELQACNSEIRKLKKVGLDMEDAIFQGIKHFFPDIKQLYCVRHLMKRDEMKLDKLFGRMKCSAAEKNKAKSEILKDIYGERKGAVYEYGLAESHDSDDFSAKLNSLQSKWESQCTGFFQWFMEKRKSKFIESVIMSAREGTDVSGLFYQNDIESMHFVEKLNQCFQKKSVPEVVCSFKSLMERQENEEIRAIYGAGSYVISTPYKSFQVDSARWHHWSENNRRDHIEKFRAYSPTLSDEFHKPKNAGRKPGFEIRCRSTEEPDVLIDRVTDQLQGESNPVIPKLTITKSPNSRQWSKCNAKADDSEIRFSDPRLSSKEKEFELHVRNNLPRQISKCQGRCGKKITPDDDLFLVRSYGTSSWTDKKTGRERSKFGPMYVHFNENCLTAYDSENHYGPGNKFDCKRVKVDAKTQQLLHGAEKAFLLKLGVTFL